MEAMMQQIQSILNHLTSKEILETLKEKSTKALFVGTQNQNDETLDEKLQDPDITLSEMMPYAFISTEIRRAYFDENTCLCFEVNLDYEIQSQNTIYALVLASEENILLTAPMPKIKKLKGIGGTFIIKTTIEGTGGEMIFKADNYISEVEFEPFRNFVSNFQSLLEQLKYEATLKMLLLDLENYLDTQISTIKAEREKLIKIGVKEYFYRNELPPYYVSMGMRLSRDDYPLLWYYTLGCAGNDGGNIFTIPKANQYSKGTNDKSLVGVFSQSGLPNITGNIYGGCDNLSGDGVFRNSGRAGWSWSGGHGGNDNNRVHMDAFNSSPIYGRSEDVEVNKVHYLEGIYAG